MHATESVVVVPVRHHRRDDDDDDDDDFKIDDDAVVSSSSFSLFVLLRTPKESKSGQNERTNERTNEEVADEINPKEKERFSKILYNCIKNPKHVFQKNKY